MPQDGQNHAIVKKPKLLDQVRNALRIKHYSMKTEEAYIHWIKKYIFFHNKHYLKEMGEMVKNYMPTSFYMFDTNTMNKIENA